MGDQGCSEARLRLTSSWRTRPRVSGADMTSGDRGHAGPGPLELVTDVTG